MNKRRDFSASALQWMDNNGQINGRESMEMIKVLSENVKDPLDGWTDCIKM